MQELADVSAMSIQNNSLSAQQGQQTSARGIAKATTELATGRKINKAADDPDGLIASSALQSQLAALDAQVSGLQRADAVATVADGYLGELSNLLQEANTANVQLANQTGVSDAERDALQMQRSYALQSFDRLANNATFNGQKLFDGEMRLSAGDASVSLDPVSLQDIGQTQVTMGGEDWAVTLADVQANANGASDVGTAASVLKNAMGQLSEIRSKLAGFQANEVQAQINDKMNQQLNTAKAESDIADAEVAESVAELVRQRLLNQQAVQSQIVAMTQSRSVVDWLA